MEEQEEEDVMVEEEEVLVLHNIKISYLGCFLSSLFGLSFFFFLSYCYPILKVLLCAILFYVKR